MKTQLYSGKLTVYLEGRIDSGSAPRMERELLAAVDSASGIEPIFEAEKLEYISSAGLRVLMKLRKLYKRPLQVVNASPEVYDIFEGTGFSELWNVRKKLREVSAEGCEFLGEGANGKIFRFTADEMIKVFRPGITLEEIGKERETSRKAFLLGVPCAVPFDTVRFGKSYGTIYELQKAATVTERIRNNPETLPCYAAASAQLLRVMHQIEVPAGQMQRVSRLLHNTVDVVVPDFTPQEIALMHRLYDAIPEMRRFIHNDYHTRNVMESRGELVLIDLGGAGAGNPIIDLIRCYMVYMLIGGGSNRSSPDEMSFIGLTYREMERFWDIFLPVYCGSEAEAERLNRILAPYALLMYLTMSMSHPRLPAQYHAAYAERIRKQVFPHAEKMLNSMSGVRTYRTV